MKNVNPLFKKIDFFLSKIKYNLLLLKINSNYQSTIKIILSLII